MLVKRTRTLVERFLSALICVALALGPVAAFGAEAETALMSASSNMSQNSPCDMPCDHCTDSKSLGCILACNGMVASMPPIDPGSFHETAALRILSAGRTLLAGRQHEPDTPPPKFDLA